MNRKLAAAIVAAAVGLLLGAVALGAAFMSVISGVDLTPDTSIEDPARCLPPVPGGVQGDKTLGPRQSANAAAIIQVGKDLKVPTRGWVVAIATAMQESQLLNSASLANPASLQYPHDVVFSGDHDSVGIFQQRDAWGPMAVRMNVAESAKMFYTGGRAGQRGLLDIHGWQTMSIAGAAQAVQVSAFPDAYAQWEDLAINAVERLADVPVDTGTDCGDIASTGPWTNPLGDQTYHLTAGFGQCSGLWSNCHTGQDMAIATGAKVYAASTGKVIRTGWGGAYGNLIKIQHADGVQTWYAHLSKIVIADGASVKPGTFLGYSGATGNTTGPHLHFEVRLNDEPIDPGPFMVNKGVRL